MPKWITVQLGDETHRRLKTAAASKGKLLYEYVVSVLEEHADKLDVKVIDKD